MTALSDTGKPTIIPLVQPDIPEKPVTSISEHTRPKSIFPKPSDFSWGESGLPNKKIIKQATEYSNLSQWIQIQIWDYCNVRLGVANHLKPESAEVVADRIIKRVLKTYAIKKH